MKKKPVFDALDCTPVSFIVKRAFRRGYAAPRDVARACAISAAGATRAMLQAERRYPALLIRSKTRLMPRPLAVTPEFASERSLFAALQTGRNNPAMTGLFADELPVGYVSLQAPQPFVPGILTELTRALASQAPLEMIYLPLEAEATPARRVIFPIGLERCDPFWYLLAQDIETPGGVLAFALAQILTLRPHARKLPRRFIAASTADAAVQLPLACNPRYTPGQVALVERWFGRVGQSDTPARAGAVLVQLFAGGPGAAQVWPPFVRRAGGGTASECAS